MDEYLESNASSDQYPSKLKGARINGIKVWVIEDQFWKKFLLQDEQQNNSNVTTLFIFIFKNLFIYFWLCWVFVAVCGLSLVVTSRGYSSLQCMGFSLRWLLLLRSTGSRPAGFSSCGLRAPERRLSSCGLVAPQHGMWDLPRPGLEPVSPALAGGFLTTVPPGKSRHYLIKPPEH